MLVLEFRLIDMVPDHTADLNKCFSKCREKGRVILTHCSTKEAIELSARYPYALVSSFWARSCVKWVPVQPNGNIDCPTTRGIRHLNGDHH